MYNVLYVQRGVILCFYPCIYHSTLYQWNVVVVVVRAEVFTHLRLTSNQQNISCSYDHYVWPKPWIRDFFPGINVFAPSGPISVQSHSIRVSNPLKQRNCAIILLTFIIVHRDHWSSVTLSGLPPRNNYHHRLAADCLNQELTSTVPRDEHEISFSLPRGFR